MKRSFSLLLIQLIVVGFASSLFAQTYWNFANPRPQGGDLYGVTIKKDSLSLVAGVNAVVVRRVASKFVAPQFLGTRRLLSASHFLDTMWVAGDSGTIYRSIDNGVNWTNVSLTGKTFSLWSAAPFNAQRVVVVGDSGYVYSTTDAGSSWTKETNTNHVRMNAVKLDSFTAYAVGQAGTLFVGNNMGAFGWTSETIATGKVLNDLSLTHTDMWVVGDSNYVQHRSTNGNALIWDSSFTSLNASLKSVVFTGQYVIAVGTGGVVLRSNDGGASWTLPSSGTTEDLLHLDTTSDASHLGTLLAVGRKGVIIKSVNYGQSWIRLDTGSRSQVLALAQSPNGNYYGSSNLGGLFSSKDLGLTWRRDSITNLFNQLSDIQFGRTGFGLMSTSGAGVLVSNDSGRTWTAKAISGTTILGIAITMDSIGMAVGANGAIYRSINNGSTWVQIASPVIKNLYDVDMYGKYGVIVGYGGASLYTLNAGLTWTSGSTTATAQLNRVRMSTATNGVAVGVVGNIWRTIDGGQHWSNVSSGTNVTLHDIAFHDDINGMIVGDGGKILKTSDGGASWSSDVAHTDQNLYGAMITSGTTAFAGGDQGTIVTTSNSLLPVELISLTGSRIAEHSVAINWSIAQQTNNAGFSIERENLDQGFGQVGWINASNTNTVSASFSFEDANALASLCTYRLSQRDLDGSIHELGIVTVDAFAGAIAALTATIYPNPASDHAFVSFALPFAGDVTVRLYDMIGRELERTTYFAQRAGTNSYRLNVAGLSTGVYRAVVESQNDRRELPLVIVR
jgi:photosystem II stability/assembly factor-like uncharacterized protein